MNLLDTLRTLARRWYITVPGIVLALGAAVFAYASTPPSYERSASLLLLPDDTSLPKNSNPYLYISGLSLAADVLVRSVGSLNTMNDMQDEFPGVKVDVTRDVSTAGPILVLKVRDTSDEVAGRALDVMIENSTAALNDLQAQQNIPPKRRITLQKVTLDAEGVPQKKSQLVAAGGVAAAGLVLTLVVASVVEGLGIRSRRRVAPEVAAVPAGQVVVRMPAHARERAGS
jgi:uncharacterized protein involved in exopolysaccharide biosynthesis